MTSAKDLSLADSVWETDGEDIANTKLLLDLYDREQISLRRYLIFLGLDAETAAETVQESFLKLHLHLLSGGERSNLRAWLFRVAHNLARNEQSSVRSSKTTFLGDIASYVNPIAPAVSAEEALLASEMKELLREAMRSLSSPQRNCLALRSQGLKYREIAEALELSVSTVAEHVQRGLEKLREKV
ncbi:MAG: RNA polymerase sigma factor [Acidobacteriota bacterium]|nr:RNA polymerase sigma factor [Acidobacteriota bacterium]MDQ2841708.1 RNA polymerase sigma factor [Acidobacteriota bacterium]